MCTDKATLPRYLTRNLVRNMSWQQSIEMTKRNGGLTSEDCGFKCAEFIKRLMTFRVGSAPHISCKSCLCEPTFWSVLTREYGATQLSCNVMYCYSLNKVFCFCFKQKKIKDSPALSPNHPALCCEVFCFLFSFLQIKENLPSSSKYINTWKGGQTWDPRRAQWHLGTSLPCPCHSHAFWTRFFPLPQIATRSL